MKIRSDFVTNSSSSSFIVAFSDEKNLYHKVTDAWIDHGKWFDIGEVIKDIAEEIHYSGVKDIKENFEAIRDMVELECRFDILRHRSYDWNFLRTDEGRKMLRDSVEKELEDITEEISRSGYKKFISMECDTCDESHDFLSGFEDTLISDIHH